VKKLVAYIQLIFLIFQIYKKQTSLLNCDMLDGEVDFKNLSQRSITRVMQLINEWSRQTLGMITHEVNSMNYALRVADGQRYNINTY
jgi:ABC-type lipoprotein export system ATPase subunit